MAGAAGRGERGAADAAHRARTVGPSCGPCTRRRAQRGAGQARARSDTPGIIADRAAPVFISDSIGAIGVLAIVVLVAVIIVAVNFIALTKAVIDIAVVTVPRRASSPAASTARAELPGLTTA